MKQERHEYIIKGDVVYCLAEEKLSNNILNYVAYPKELQAGTHMEVNVMEDEASSVTGCSYATISQHFLPPPAADVYLITFTHSYPSCLLLSTVAETVSHFKVCESSFQKTLPPFNLSNAP